MPSKISDKPVSSVRTSDKIVTVSLKDATKVEDKPTQTTVSLRIPSEKPKRLDTTFARSTERAVNDLDSSTVPVNRSTLSNLSTVPLTPRISATETIRARISSISPDVVEKRAKFLSESHVSSSPSSVNNPDASWSDLKTVGEVHYNNVTLGKSLAQEEPIKSVNGKIDSEEIAEKVSSEPSSTERSAEEHETQLQKSNSSRIVDVQEDNSLSSFQSNRQTIPVTTEKLPTAASDEGIRKSTKDEKHALDSSNMDRPSSTETKIQEAQNGESMKSQGIKITETTIPVAFTSTERLNNEESTEKVTEKDVYSTTEDEFTTTDVADETTIVDETTTLSHIPNVKPAKMIENLVEAETTTTFIPTTSTDDVTTTILETSTKVEEEGKVHHEPSENVVVKGTSTESVATAPKTTSERTSLITNSTSTTQEVTKSATQPTKSTSSKPTSTDSNQRIIVSSTEEKVSESILSSTSTTTTTTQSTVPQSTQTVAHANVSERSKLPVTPRINLASTGGIVHRKSPDANNEETENQTEIDQKPNGNHPDINAMIAIVISVVAVVTLILLAVFLYVMRKRQKQLTYGQRCRPIGLDAYSLDNISVYNSVRRKSANRASKRAFGNVGFDDPDLKNNALNISQLATFSQKRVSINDEFRDVPTVTARIEEVPVGCEDKNR